MSRVLVTGASGFIGSKLVPILSQTHDVAILERYVTGRYGRLDRNIETHFADLCDFTAVTQILRLTKPEVIIHLASLSPVNYSYDHPLDVMETNLMASINIAESARKFLPEFKHFIFSGTSEEYGTTPDRPATENTRCQPNSPYSASKYAMTNYLLYMKRAYDFPSTIIRSTNTYGRLNDTNFFMERAMNMMLQKQPRVILGDPTPIRDWLYIDDHVNGYLAVLNNPEKSIGEIFNLSTNRSMTIRQTANFLAKILDYRGEIVWGGIPKRPLDIIDHRIDSSKIKRVLGWSAQVSLEDGIKALAKTMKA